MDSGYWIIEYGKVLFGYLFLMFLWPSVVFRGHLRTKSKTYCFSFCVTVTIVVINSIVLMLGLFHALDQRVVFILFYGWFAIAFVRNLLGYFHEKNHNLRSLYGKYRVSVIILLFIVIGYKKVKRALRSCNWNKIGAKMKKCIRNIRIGIGGLFWKYGLIAIVLVYGMVYFSYGAFQMHAYGHGDLYTHHGWIYALIEGNVFRDGIYPEAMHCFIYCMNTLFGIRVYSILLFLQGIHVAVLLLSVYILLRRIFYWKYSPLFVLMLFLTIDLTSVTLILNMFRLQITLPQEFGLHTIFLSAYYLVNYLYEDSSTENRAAGLKQFRNKNLLLLAASMAAAATIHFFVVIMACIVCVTFVIFHLKKLFTLKKLIPLSAAAFCACMISTVPYAGALAQGVPLSDSIHWAIGTMNKEDSISVQENVNLAGEPNEDRNAVFDIGKIYSSGYVALYGRKRANAILSVTAIMIILCCLFRVKYRSKPITMLCSGYCPVILGSVLYIIIYAAPKIGLPGLIPEGRFFVPGHMMLLAVMIMPMDLIFYQSKDFCKNVVQQILSALVIMGIYVGAVTFGFYRGFLFYELSRYHSAVNVTNSIIDTFPEHSYTIVSPTDELYSIVQYGWHEELLTFMEKCEEEDYTLPTENVFIYIEKRPIDYAQYHFFRGSSWIGDEKYPIQFLRHSDKTVSQSPEIKKAQISKEEVQKDLPEVYSPWLIYKQVENRVILESKAYDWCQRFIDKYPSVMKTFYEDDDFVCYFFKQDVYDSLYNLNL